MRRALVLLFLVLPACSSPAPQGTPAPGPERAPVRELTPAERLELAREVHRRGPAHEKLDALEGEWEVAIVSQLADGSQRRTLGRGLAHISWVLGRRFLDWDLKLAVGEESHSVRGFLGYDVLLQEYQALWISEVSTGMSLARGDGDPEGRGIVLQARPSAAAAAPGSRSLLRIQDKDHFVIDSLATDARGQDGVVQVASYTRRAAAAPR